MSEAVSSKRAVVVGGSLGGLLAARVLSDHFADVTIVERDSLPDGADFRPAVPQGRHAHAIIERGRRIMEALLPGFSDELRAAGARMIDGHNDLSWMSWFGEVLRFPSDVPMLNVSRPLLDHHVRRRVLALPRIKARQTAAVTALAGTAQRVTGVRLANGEEIGADLVVDASGRDSAAPSWLQALGLPPPVDSTVKSFVGYATRWYEAPQTKVWDRDTVIATGRPPHFTRTVFLVPVEDNRVVVTLAGLNGDYPPTDEAGALEFARSIGVPGLVDWLAAARPLGPLYGFRFEQNRLRHFERCKLPSGFIALGDAVVSFNPIYGQGMSTASIAVELLQTMLAEGADAGALSRRYHGRLAKLLAPMWTQTTTEDLRYPGTEGKRDFSQRIARAYVDRLFLLSATKPDVKLALFNVIAMIEPPTTLFQPKLIWRVLTTSIPRTMPRAHEALAPRSMDDRPRPGG
jgi:2-polyprenyl-6-methoxyphenol hydroxylase-like FAD-dependent oxidoreductase